MLRKPAVAGQFYSFDESKLKESIQHYFQKGPGNPGKNKEDSLVSLVCPHAGLMFSGWVAAYSYKEAAERSKPETVIILSPNHTGLGKLISVFPEGEWETPLGVLEVDSELGKKIVDSCPGADFDDEAHRFEHSVEVQLPFLQTIYDHKFRILPITMMAQNKEVARDLADSLLEAVGSKKVLVVASSDFTHYEPYESALSKDMKAVKSICAMDVDSFEKDIISQKMSICGYAPIMAAVYFAKARGVKQGKLLKYATSGDITGDLSKVVGYASISFSR